jgi:hypothetical protein
MVHWHNESASDSKRGVDFGVFQLGGELAADRAWGELYDGNTFSSRFQSELFPSLAEERTLNPFISTPSFALAVQPLAGLPFSVALVLWTVLTLGICTVCVRALGLNAVWAIGLVPSPALAVILRSVKAQRSSSCSWCASI